MKKTIYKYIVWVFIISFILFLKFAEWREETKNIKLGIFSGSMYDVPTMQSYKIFDEAIDSFTHENKKIKISYEYGVLKNDYSEWLSSKILYGESPDIMVVLEEDFNTFVSLGILEPLDKYMENDSEFNKNLFYEQALSLGKSDSSQYALPMEIDPVLLFVNKTLMKKEGITLDKDNWTWEKFYDVCQKVTKDLNNDGVIDQFGVVDFTWQDLVYTNGETFFSKDGTKAEFDKKGVVEAINFAQKLYNLNHNASPQKEDFDKGNVLFKPFPFSWYRVYNSYPYRLIRYSNFEWECIKLPKGPNGKNSSQLKGYLIGISSKSKNKKVAWKFLKKLVLDKEIQGDIFKYSQGVPVLKEITESVKANEELKKYNPEENISIDKRILSEIVEDSVISYKFKNYEKILKQADLNINQMIYENKDIESSMPYLNKELNNLINKEL